MSGHILLNNTDITLQPVMMGTWQADVRCWPAFREADFLLALERAYRDGVRCFDTAEVYSNGESERQMGNALKTLSEGK